MQQAQYQPVGFVNATRQQVIPLNGLSYVKNGTSTIQIPQIGLMSRILLNVVANVTTSNGGSDAFLLNVASESPDPFNCIQRIRVYTGTSELFNLTTPATYITQRIIKGVDNRNVPTSLSSANAAAAIYYAPANPAKNTTYNVTFTLEIPLAWGAMLEAGLISLQDPTTRIFLDIVWGDAAAVLTATTGTVTVNSCTISAVSELYKVPDHREDYPDMSVAHTWSEEVIPIVAPGRFVYRPNLGRTVLDYVCCFSFNGTRGTPAQVTQSYLQYAQTVTPYTQPTWAQGYRGRQILGMDLPDGCHWFPLSEPFGFVDIPGSRDTLDTSLQTDFSLQFDIAPGTSMTNAYMRVIKRELSRWAV